MEKRTKIQQVATRAIINNNWTGLVDVSPRVGKTKIGIESIRGKEKRNIAVIYPYNTIKEAWLEEIHKWNLGFTPILLNQRNLEELPENLDLLIWDEIQTASDNQLNIVKSKNPKRVLGLSGTLSDKTKKRLKEVFKLSTIYKYSIEEAIADGIISDYVVYIKEVDLLDWERKRYNELTKNFEYFKQLAFQNPKLTNAKNMAALKRAQFIYKLESKQKAAKELIDSLDRCIVFTVLTDVADNLCDYSYHSKSNPHYLELFQKERIDKLAVAQMVSMGFTAKSLKQAVMHQIQSNEELQIQKMLRACNLEDDKVAEIYITVAKNTKDVDWLTNSLKSINPKRIKYL